MAEKRDKVFIWVTWLSKLIAGESQCEYAPWFKAHYKSDKISSNNFDLVKWTINHNQLLHTCRDELEQQGYIVQIEDQNSFKLSVPENPQSVVRGNSITISGKVDIVGLPGPCSSIKGKGCIKDCKTGKCKNSDQVQVMLYMIFLPIAIKKYAKMVFDGAVVYKDSEVSVNWLDIDDTLKKVVWNLVGRIGGSEPCRKSPSYNECKWCDIHKVDCPERMEG